MISKKAKKKQTKKKQTKQNKKPPKTRRMADVMEMTEIRSRLKMAIAKSSVRAFVIRRHYRFPFDAKSIKKATGEIINCERNYDCPY